MNAVVSGRAGVALLLHADGKLFSVHQGDSDKVIPRRAEEFSWLLGDATDLEFYDGIESSEVPPLLDFAAQREEALDIALIVLDGDLPESVRTQAAEDLQECFSAPQVQDTVEAVLYAAPLPEDTDLKSALRLALTNMQVHAFLKLLRDRQPVIRKVRQAWESVEDQHFGGRQERRDAQTLCVRAGLFRDLVQSLADGKAASNVLVQIVTQNPKLRLFQKGLERWGTALSMEEAATNQLGPGNRICPFLNEQGRVIGMVAFHGKSKTGIVELLEELAEPYTKNAITPIMLATKPVQPKKRRRAYSRLTEALRKPARLGDQSKWRANPLPKSLTSSM